MSDSEHSTVTYTSVSFPVEDDSDIGSPGVDGPPVMPEDPYAYIMAAYGVPPSPDYIPGPEGPPSPDYVPGPEEPEQAQPSPVYLPYQMHAAASPTAESPGYIPKSDPEEEDLEDDDEDEDKEEDPAPADSVLPIPSPPPNSPTHIEVPESCLPLRKWVHFASPTPSHEVGESSAAGAARQDRPTIPRDDPYSIAREDLYGFVDMVDVPPRCSTSRELDYSITDTWDDLVGAIDKIAPTTLEGVNKRITNFSTVVEQETTIMYGIMEDARDDWSQLRGRVNLSYRDRPIHSRLAMMVEREAKMAREAWGPSIDSSDYAPDHKRQRVISELSASDHRSQVQLIETLRLLKGLQTQMVVFQRQHRPAKGSEQPDAPGETGSSS
ncbi:hypothetical protein Tco_0152462 [Tanacetum coccineum]